MAAPVLAAIQGLTPELGLHAPLQLSAGTSRPPDQLAARLVGLGYTRTDVVEHRGEFAVRGGIVDVFPSTARRPVRAEFYGDDIESLRQFSAATQLSTGRIDAIDIHPSRELLPTADVRRRADGALPRYRGQFRAALERLSEGQSFEGMEQAIPLLYQPLPLLFDLAPPGSHYTHRVIDAAVRLVVEAGLPYRAAPLRLWRDHRVLVPFATIRNWVEAGGEKKDRQHQDHLPRRGVG